MRDNIILNRIRTPDGTVLTSYHRHDYKTHVDANGDTYMVDGGCSYLRRTLNEKPYEELSIWDDSPFKVIRESMYWGTRGISGMEPLKWVVLKDLNSDHIRAILATQHQVPEWRKELFMDELDYRGEEYE